MGYAHIKNLYADTKILAFREVYAMEKIHGTSAHISWHDGNLRLSGGAESHEAFAPLFDQAALRAAFEAMGHASVGVYGEAYGGPRTGQSWRYGPTLRFIAFDVRVGDMWLAVPSAAALVATLKLEFVHWTKVTTDLDALDAERDAPSVQAVRNCVEGVQPREGVVLRPPFEVTLNNGERVSAKHKRKEERETATFREVDQGQAEVLEDAERIAEEWVTPTRLEHVLDKIQGELSLRRAREVIAAMLEDVLREAGDEIVDSAPARKAIGSKTAELLKARLAIVTKT